MCGILGILANEPVSTRIYYGLRALQHRGQESAGIAVLSDGGELCTHKDNGLVDQGFSAETLK
jgi:amidophosphoribosyltransferase